MATFTKFTDNHGVARKGDKLDIVALSFENNTTAIFDECLSDQGFKDLFIANATESIDNLVSILSTYAENNLI